DEAGGLADGLLANGGHADFVDDFVAGAGGVEGGHIGRAVEETKGVTGVADRSVFEGKGLGVRHPAGGDRLEFVPEISPHVEVARTGAAAEPFDGAAGGE